MRLRQLLVGAPLIVALGACGSSSSSSAPDSTVAGTNEQGGTDDGHNAQNSLDWAGAYRGTLPCADCPGIDTVLVLKPDLTFQLSRVYADRADDNTDTERGSFTWIDGSIVELGGIDASAEPTRYRVEEGRLRQLDIQGAEVTGPSADQYVLSKQPDDFVAPTGAPSIEGTTWQLVQLGDRQVTGTASTHYIKLADGKLSGKAGCNQLIGTYSLGKVGELSFGPVGSTKMLCENMTDEESLVDVLGKTTSVSLFTGNLTLHQGDASLAVFTPVP